MKRSLMLLLLLTPLGCFQQQDQIADRALQAAIQEQRLMLSQDQAFERERLNQARIDGLAIIEAKRIATGKSLEGLNGPDGRPLLSWDTAEVLNAAFNKLQGDYNQACNGLSQMIDVKYKQREVPVKITEAYLDYIQTRRHTSDYAISAFVTELTGIGAKETRSIQEMIESLKSAGMPTSVQELSTWLQTRAKTLVETLMVQVK